MLTQQHIDKVLNALVGIGVFMTVFAIIMFFFPEGGGYFIEMANFEEANPLVTPEHIAPVWYFTPFYAILRAIPDKLLGVVGMGLSIAVLFILPWLDRCKVKSIRYRGLIHKINIAQFTVSFIVLGYLGAVPATPTLTIVARIFTLTYFGFFVALWVYSKNEKTKPEPTRVTH